MLKFKWSTHSFKMPKVHLLKCCFSTIQINRFFLHNLDSKNHCHNQRKKTTQQTRMFISIELNKHSDCASHTRLSIIHTVNLRSTVFSLFSNHFHCILGAARPSQRTFFVTTQARETVCSWSNSTNNAFPDL